MRWWSAGGQVGVCPPPDMFHVVYRRDFFKHLTIHRGYERSREIFIFRSLLFAFASLGIVVVIAQLAGDGLGDNPFLQLDLVSLFMSCACLFLFFAGSLWMTGFISALVSAIGRRSYRAASLIAMYAYSSFLPLIVGAAILGFGVDQILLATVREDIFSVILRVSGAAAVGCSAVLLYLTCSCYRRAFRDTRWANG